VTVTLSWVAYSRHSKESQVVLCDANETVTSEMSSGDRRSNVKTTTTSAYSPTRDDVEEEDYPDDQVVKVPSLKSRSVQDILSSSDMASITHHEGSGNTYMANKILKLQTMHNPTGDAGHTAASSIFRGCFLFVNGDTTPPRYEIQRLVSD
jgi:hypothetical protein